MKNKKKFKDTKFGKIVCNKIPMALNIVGDLLPDNGVMGVVKNLITNSDLSDDEKQDLLKQQKDFELKELDLYLKDIQDARSMQEAALGQEDKFSKHFVYILAIISVVLGFAYIFMITLIEIRPENQRFADTILGVVIAMIFGSIYNFFFGSSKGSADKSKELSRMTGKIIKK